MHLQPAYKQPCSLLQQDLKQPPLQQDTLFDSTAFLPPSCGYLCTPTRTGSNTMQLYTACRLHCGGYAASLHHNLATSTILYKANSQHPQQSCGFQGSIQFTKHISRHTCSWLCTTLTQTSVCKQCQIRLQAAYSAQQPKHDMSRDKVASYVSRYLLFRVSISLISHRFMKIYYFDSAQPALR